MGEKIWFHDQGTAAWGAVRKEKNELTTGDERGAAIS